MSTHTFTAAQAARLRIQCQSLVGEAHASVTDVAEHMLAMQGQDFNAVQWALGVRAPGTTRDDVVDAFNSGAIVRGWPMRGTLHALPADTLPWLLELTTERVLRGVQRRWDVLDIDEAWLERVRDAVIPMLTGGERMSRKQLIEALADAGFEMTGSRGYHAIWYLSQTGSLVWGPIDGNEHLLVLSEEWLPKPRAFDRDKVLGELLRRYVHARGPVTLKDFAWWTGLTQGDAKVGLGVAGDALAEVDVDGTTMYMSAEALDTYDPDDRTAKSSVLATAAFDEHLLGYQNRDIQLPAEHAGAIVPGNNGMFKATIVIGGVAVGTWARTKRAKRIDVTTELFGSLTKAQRSKFVASLERYGAFMGAPVELVD
jgi:hypothetical protein